MNGTKLYWVDGPWPGRLAMSARPRGGDWLEDEITSWQRNGADVVCSLLTSAEEHDLNIECEETETRAHGMGFVSFPIADRQVPDSERDFSEMLHRLDHELSAGHNVVLHCRQGVGRTGLVAACLLRSKGMDAKLVLEQLTAIRGAEVPETQAQRQWIDRYGENLIGVR